MSTKTCPYCAEEIKAEAIRCRYCHSWLSRPPEWSGLSGAGSGWDVGPVKGRPGRLRRPASGGVLAGVCAAFGDFFGIDPTWIRVAYVVATVLTLGVPGVVLYVILALIIPSEDGPGLV